MAVGPGVYIDDGDMVSCAKDGGESCRRVLADEDASMNVSSSSPDSEFCMVSSSSSSSASVSSSSLSSTRGRSNVAEDDEGHNGIDCAMWGI